uniref:Ig-like domain-containing protein n=1 Tax=Lates calcarifer TaxID=8187 RepID=A0A4W6EQY7_LATCA
MDPLCLCVLTVSQHTSAMELFEGEGFVLLPCEYNTFDLDDPIVVWSRNDLSPSTVHQRQPNGDELKDQNQLYSGRTSMMPDALEEGDLSLNLTKLQVSDSGNYTCTIRSVGGRRSMMTVQLQVKGQQQTTTLNVIKVRGQISTLGRYVGKNFIDPLGKVPSGKYLHYCIVGG